ncbi:MAG: M48 family metallopeptidase [Pseudomonadota bacterium]
MTDAAGAHESCEVAIDDRQVTFEVNRSRRRRSRVGINFETASRVRLDTPPLTGVDELREMVEAHRRWFVHRLRSVREQSPEFRAPAYRHGELLLLGGEALMLCVCFDSGARASAERVGTSLRVICPTDDARATDALVRRIVRAYQTDCAKTLFEGTLERLVDDIDWLDHIPTWRVRFMRSQWGSCSSSGRLCLNTHLVKLPTPLVDYVLLHELCHLRYMDHGRRFRGLLAAHMPDWEKRRSALNRYAGLLAEG